MILTRIARNAAIDAWRDLRLEVHQLGAIESAGPDGTIIEPIRSTSRNGVAAGGQSREQETDPMFDHEAPDAGQLVGLQGCLAPTVSGADPGQPYLAAHPLGTTERLSWP